MHVLNALFINYSIIIFVLISTLLSPCITPISVYCLCHFHNHFCRFFVQHVLIKNNCLLVGNTITWFSLRWIGGWRHWVVNGTVHGRRVTLKRLCTSSSLRYFQNWFTSNEMYVFNISISDSQNSQWKIAKGCTKYSNSKKMIYNVCMINVYDLEP